MSFSHEYNFPVFVGSGNVKTSGHSSTLAPGQLGIFVGKTLNALSGAAPKYEALKIVQGSLHNVDKLGNFFGGLKQSDKSPEFLISDILSFEKSLPREARSEEWTLGWDGVDDTTASSFVCEKEYRFKVKVWGEDVYGTFLRPLEREVGIRTGCCAGTDCVPTCDDAVATKGYYKELSEAINKDPELKFFVNAEAIYSDAVTNAATHRIYTIVVPDDGSAFALAAVQAAVGGTLVVSRDSRSGIYTTYSTLTTLSGGSPVDTPDNYTPTGSILLAECGVCPSGYTEVQPKETYIITRPLAGTENLVGGTAQQTFADVVKLAYFAAHTFDGATAVDPATDQITVAAHGFVANTPVVYSNGGGTTIVGLTNGSTYYIKTVVDANNVTLSATPGGTVINITADGVGASHTLTIASTATFLSQNGAFATIKLVVDSVTTDLVAILSDSLDKVSLTPAVCTPPAGSAISWTVGDDRHVDTRVLSVTLDKVCGTGNRLAELQAFYANDPSIVSGTLAVRTAGTCNDIYEVHQYSKDFLVDGCLTEGVPHYDNLQTFEGFSWIQDADAAGSTTVKAGVRVKTAYSSTQFGNCSFSPADYYSVRPLQLEITALDESGRPCVPPIPSRKTVYASMSTQGGEWMMREYIRQNVYRVAGEFYADPRMREVLDSIALDVVDRNKPYVVYFFKVRQHRVTVNHTADFSPEIFEFQIAFPLGTDTAAFELAFGAVTSQNKVFLANR